MLNIILDILFEFVVNILFVFPGAFVRWMFTGFKGSYKKILESSSWEMNAFIGIIVLAGVIVLIANIDVTQFY